MSTVQQPAEQAPRASQIPSEHTMNPAGEEFMHAGDAVLRDHNPRLTPLWRVVIIVLTVAGILLTMNQVFFWNLGDLAVLTNSFLYLLMACFVPIVFIVNPLRIGGIDSLFRTHPPTADRVRRLQELAGAAAPASGGRGPWG